MDLRIKDFPENVQNAIRQTMEKNGICITDDLLPDFLEGKLSDLTNIIGEKAVEYYSSFYEETTEKILEEVNKEEDEEEYFKEVDEDTKRILRGVTEEDFADRYNKKYPNGLPDEVIAQAMEWAKR